MKILLTILLSICINGLAQSPDSTVYEVTSIEEQPEFKGGQPEMYKYLGKNINYPVLAKENGISGKVFIEFIINRDGTIGNVVVLKGVKATAPSDSLQPIYTKIAKSMDDEALRVIRGMPPWSPGKMSGRTVRTRFILPINYKLQ